MTSSVQTCKYLHKIFGEHSVWIAVLRDIMDVIPLRRVVHALPSMSASELRQKAMLITRLDSVWSFNTARPMKMASHPLDFEVCVVHIWPGGDFILTLLRDGELRLYPIQDMTNPLLTVPRPDRASCKYFPESADMRRTCNTHGEYWVVVVDYYLTPE